MADLSDIRIPKFADPVQGETLGDVYFEATSISPDPTGLGSDEQFDVAHNQIVGGGGGGHAFQLVQTGATTIKIRYGTVNGIAPSQVDVNFDNATEFNVGSVSFWLDVTFNSTGSVTGVNIQTRTSSPPSPTTTNGYLQIGSTYSNGSEITSVAQNISGSQSVASCGTTHFFGLI